MLSGGKPGIDAGFQGLPKRWGPAFDLAGDACLKLVVGNAIGDPACATCLKVGNDGLDPVDRLRKDRIVSFGSFELFPEGTICAALICGKDVK